MIRLVVVDAIDLHSPPTSSLLPALGLSASLQFPNPRKTMNVIDSTWLNQFDDELLHLFAVSHSDIGVDASDLSYFADLAPRAAALAFGQDYDLDRDDALWPRLRPHGSAHGC